jgi:O-Antigen ligase
VSAHAAPADLPSLGRVATVARPSSAVLWTLGFGCVLTAIAFVGGGGLDLKPATTVEISLDLAGGALIVGAILAGRTARPVYGAGAMWLFAAFAALTALSVIWSVQPSDSWLEANRTLAYALTFAGAVVLAREAPARWDALIGGVALSCAAICGWALLTKVFPGALAHDETFARLRAPYSYWNAIGLTAALGVPACLWIGTRRHGHATINALGYPAIAVFIVTLLLAYSRGAVLALAIGLAVWFWLVPLRLRGVAVLGVGGGAAVAVSLWVFSQGALRHDNVAIPARAMAGHRLGFILAVMVVALYGAGLAISFAATRHRLSPVGRHRAGMALIAILCAVPVAVALKLATSQRGLSGSISYGFNQLTDAHSKLPGNDPSRLSAIGSVRARYWNDALNEWKEHPVKGVGAGGFGTARTRVRTDVLTVQHAHGFLVQTLADLGIIGLTVALALLAAWLAAAMRTIGRKRDGAVSTPERIGMLTLMSIVVVFGVHSLIDWTWFIPGNAVPALLCAGWLAGRGPLPKPDEPASEADAAPLSVRVRSGVRQPLPAARGALALVFALAAVWAAWQPLRAQDAGDHALALAEQGHFAQARAAAQDAIDRNPLSADWYFDLAVIDTAAGDAARTQRDYQRAVQLQPSNPETWLALAQYELDNGNPRGALAALGPELYLDPRSPEAIATFLQARNAVQQAG